MKMRDKVSSLKTTQKPSSQRWLLRQLNDPYVRQARQQGYRCRSSFKLLELHQQFNLFRPGMSILDLGCAPGGWCQAVSQCLEGEGHIIGVDKLPMVPLPLVCFHQGDILDPVLEEEISRSSFHVVLSDMAPSSTGHKTTDRLQMETLMETVWAIACHTLLGGGHLIMKAFHGHNDLMKELKRAFRSVHYVKPKASRVASREIYVIALDFKV